MSMHLCGPALTTTGKRKAKFKWPSAEAKRKAEQLDNDWKEIKKKHGAEQEERKRRRAMSAEPLVYNLDAPVGRTTAHIPSRNTGEISNGTYRASPQYTGTKVKGIGTMHKSNAVPIFSDEEAVAIATMRR